MTVIAIDAANGVIVIKPTPADASHLHIALDRHRKHLRSQGQPVATGLAAYQAAALRVLHANSRQTATVDDRPVGVLGDPRHAGERGCEPLTPSQVAAEIGVSTRTVGRMLDRGDLPAVTVGRRRRVTRQALDHYLAATGVDAA